MSPNGTRGSTARANDTGPLRRCRRGHGLPTRLIISSRPGFMHRRISLLPQLFVQWGLRTSLSDQPIFVFPVASRLHLALKCPPAAYPPRYGVSRLHAWSGEKDRNSGSFSPAYCIAPVGPEPLTGLPCASIFDPKRSWAAAPLSTLSISQVFE